MSTLPRRGRFQIHLSTAIVLMFAAGGIIWANTREQTSDIEGLDGLWHVSDYGWPAPMLHSKTFTPLGTPARPNKFSPIYLLMFCDFAAALAILFVVWFLCERLMYRRGARNVDLNGW